MDARYIVAPLVGAWIEMTCLICPYVPRKVAPLVGAWIEISQAHSRMLSGAMSHPSWVRGLKFGTMRSPSIARCRTPRGCVD